MLWTESIPELGPVATYVGLALVVFAAVGIPPLAVLKFARLERDRPTDPDALVRFYRSHLITDVAGIVVIVAVLVLASDLAPGDVGLRPPLWFTPVIGAVLGGLLAWLVTWLITRERKSRGRNEPLVDPDSARTKHVITTIAARSRRERRLAWWLVVGSAVFEELLYRSLFLALGLSLGLPLWEVVLASSVLYALAHLYQGWHGLVVGLIIGLLSMVVYIGTGTIFFTVAFQVYMNVRVLLLSGAGRRHRQPQL
ncbi:CPBP family intramembrane glutamic endopeptidase [Salinactinospora qingdaonensis]|uniref:CAAX prenyl protease 2/Lysostaphin resistance protein A-like domain-containing protein n=1 Tax=Salinactinospora qingdaonensis TaxID=702744 RepID=A0ABP7FH13_9ACTN